MNQGVPGDIANLSNIIDASHENKWVAIAADYSKVIAASDSLRELVHSVKDDGAIYHRVLPRDAGFAPVA